MYYIVINGTQYIFSSFQQAKREIPKICLASIEYDEELEPLEPLEEIEQE